MTGGFRVLVALLIYSAICTCLLTILNHLQHQPIRGSIPKTTQGFQRLKLGHPEIKIQEHIIQEFQPVGDDHETFVYSAYYDYRVGDLLRIMILVKDNLPAHLFGCLSKDPVSEEFIIFKGQLDYIPEPKYGYKYRSAILSCDLVVSSNRPKHISVFVNSTAVLLNQLQVEYNNITKRNFTRCVPALHSFHDKMALIQMIEQDLSFGMEKFIMYDYANSTVKDILDYYKQQNVVDVHTWNLPIKATDIHYYGQLLNIHDCLFKNMHTSKYVLLADVDEIVVSRRYKSWTDMVNGLFRPNCGALMFRNAFFPTFFKSTKKIFKNREEAVRHNMTFFLKTTRTRVHNNGDRSKVLVKPESVRFSEIHNIKQYVTKKFTTCPVNLNNALLHHYRTTRAPDMRLPYLEDTTIHDFSASLIQNIVQVIQNISLVTNTTI